MSDVQENPANDPLEIPKDFMPMSMQQQKLKVPKRQGYHRHWFRGDAGRIQKAMQAGYRFVDPSQVNLNNFDLGGDAKVSGNSDMGESRVSVISGDEADPATGQPGRLYLMECPEHLYQLSVQHLEKQSEGVVRTIAGGMIGEEQMDARDKKHVTVKSNLPAFFNPNKNRRPG